MELTAESIREYAREYLESEPLAAVEEEHVRTLPRTFTGGEYGRRDVEWVVQWYFRRYLGAYPDRERRRVETRFRENDFGTVLETLSTVAERPGETGGNLRSLIDLDGVDVPVASAFLQFTAPERYIAVDPRLWQLLRERGDLGDPYPEPPSVEGYLGFDATCHDLAGRFDVDAWTLYRGLWRAWKDRYGESRDPIAGGESGPTGGGV